MSHRHIRRAFGALFLILVLPLCAAASSGAIPPGGDVHGVVTDSTTGSPLGSANVSVMRGTQIIANVMTDAFGRYVVHDVPSGTYSIYVRFIGFAPLTSPVTVANSDVRFDAKLSPAVIKLDEVKVTSSNPIAVDTRTGDQTFSQDKSHVAPSTTTSQVVQQSIAGAVRAPTGEVHIRGQHAEYTYYVDGVPVPSGVSGSLNELFDPAIVNTIGFRTGGWDAEYGGKNAAIIDVSTRIPAGGFHMNAAGYGGAFNASGESVSASGNSGNIGFFGALSRQVTDMRTEPVMFDTTTFKPTNFHNHGEDLFGFGKIQITPSPLDVINLEGNWSRTKFQVPFDSSGGTQADDNQQDVNAFVNLGWRHRFSTPAEEANGGELFVGAFYRHGSLTFTPGINDDPQFVFFPDTTAYNLSENRNFNTSGAKIDYLYRVSHAFEFKTGVLGQFTTGQEDFLATTPAGGTGPASNSGLSGNDVGVYAQISWAPSEHFELRTGVRYDSHSAPFASVQTQVSPRVRLNFFIDPANTLYLYYGRQFIPTNVEDLRSVTSVADSGVVTAPTLPERDNFYEAGYVHRFPVGIVTKFSWYLKQSSPGIDDNTVPGSAIVTDVNIEQIHITGIEGVIELHPNGPLSGNLNVALNHGYGSGAVTGGFFPTSPPAGNFDEDHDQRLSIFANLTYSAGKFYLSASEIYGSGLTNGVDPSDCNCKYGTGLFDFNTGIKVKPNYITNLSAGYTFFAGRTTVRPELFVENLFDRAYLLKGAFFSGASVGRPRSIQFRMNVGM